MLQTPRFSMLYMLTSTPPEILIFWFSLPQHASLVCICMYVCVCPRMCIVCVCVLCVCVCMCVYHCIVDSHSCGCVLVHYA